MRIIQISDTHLSVKHDHFVRNAEIISQHVRQQSPDLIIHTGDLSMDAAGGVVADLEMARDWNAALPAEVLSIPGNHDVGDLPSLRADQALDDERLAQWRDTIGGPGYWVRDLNGWRLIGLNTMLCSTGHPAEEEQLVWLEQQLSDSQPIALFTHKPFCVDKMDEGPCGYWTIAPEPRARLLSLLAGKPVKLIASGHLHIQRHKVIDGVDHIWSPASSFVVGPMQQDLGGDRVIGYVEHVFEADRVISRFVRPDGVEDLVFDTHRKTIYPD
ncbi:MAG: metallophosphoesterase [Pseudomonadota bacterium]